MRCEAASLRTELHACSSYIDRRGRMILLHGFMKKTQKTPREDLELAKNNKSKHQAGLK